MLPLEQGQSLVDQREDIDSHGLAVLLHFHRLVELLDGLREVLLVKQQLTVVVVDIRHILEVLGRASERSHGGSDGSHFVLRHTQLDVRVDEAAVKINRLLVVLGRLCKLSEDEVQLRTVVVDVRVILVVRNRELKVIRSSILVSCSLSEKKLLTNNMERHN